MGSVSIRTSASSSSASSTVITGIRPTSSGIRPNLTRSWGYHLCDSTLWVSILVLLELAAKAQRGGIGALLDQLFQPVEGTAADKEDVLGVDLDELLLGVLAPALGRHIAHRTLQDLQQRLLHALAAHVPGDGGVLRLAGDLVDLIDVDDAASPPWSTSKSAAWISLSRIFSTSSPT